MTTVFLWRAAADEIRCVSDGRISAGNTVLTDRGAKLIEIPVGMANYHNTGYGPMRPLCQLGFAFAGSSLVGLNTVAAVLPLWSKLEFYLDEQRVPDLIDCAKSLSIFLEGYSRDVYASGGSGRCECLLFGWNGPGSAASAVRLKAEKIGQELSCTCRDVDLPDGHIEVLGTEEQAVLAAYSSFVEGEAKGIRDEYSPYRFMKQFLRQEQIRGIGGALQFGISKGNFFQVMWAGDFKDSSQPEMLYRGFDMRIAGEMTEFARCQLPGFSADLRIAGK